MNKNKLIAKFMGMTYGDTNDGSVMTQMTSQGNEVVPIESMKYHSSWDWLMPVVEKCFNGTAVQVEDNKDNFFDIKNSLPNMEATYKAVVEFIEGLSVEPDTKATDEAYFAGFCHALEYVKAEVLNVGDIEHEVDESVGDLYLSGTITIQVDQYLDADGLVDEVMRKYERDTTKDGSNV
tara:strand:- start:704 stop:1240 length:537 start_codon:yes stop_codon:yes gene_type:complete